MYTGISDYKIMAYIWIVEFRVESKRINEISKIFIQTNILLSLGSCKQSRALFTKWLYLVRF